MPSDAAPTASIAELEKCIAAPGVDAETVAAKEQAIHQLSELYVQSGLSDKLVSLVTALRPFFAVVPKAKTAKVVRMLIDSLAKIPDTLVLQMQLCRDSIEWCKVEKRSFLRQRVQARLAALMLEAKNYTDALALLEDLNKEVKKCAPRTAIAPPLAAAITRSVADRRWPVHVACVLARATSSLAPSLSSLALLPRSRPSLSSLTLAHSHSRSPSLSSPPAPASCRLAPLLPAHPHATSSFPHTPSHAPFPRYPMASQARRQAAARRDQPGRERCASRPAQPGQGQGLAHGGSDSRQRHLLPAAAASPDRCERRLPAR